MTTYYKGNNIGLNYDATTATWSFTNEPQDFIDTSAFSTKDPAFNYTPPSSDDNEQEEDTNCPAGYIYDNTLKQCVPDPAIQNRYTQQNQGGGNTNPPVQIAGTNRTTTDNNFIATDAEYQAMSAGELIENLKQRGFMEKDESGNLVVNLERGSIGSTIIDNLFGKVSPTKLNTQLNKQQKIISLLIDKGVINQMDAYPQGGISATDPNASSMKTKFVIPTIQKFEADYYGIDTSDVIVPGWNNTIYGKKESVQKFDDYMTKKLAAFKTVANNAISSYTKDGYSARLDSLDAYKKEQEKEKARKAKFQADIDKAKAEREMQKTIREAEERKKLEDELDSMLKDKDKKRKEKEKKLRDELSQDISSQVPGSTFTGGGTTLGSSVHGTGSYNPYGQGDNQGGGSSGGSSGGTLGSSVHGTGSYNPKPDKNTCFHPEQLFGDKLMKDLEPGDLINGKEIYGVIKLKLKEDMYSISDVKVTGTHRMKYEDSWIFVADHPDSFKIDDKPEFVYIPIIEDGIVTINNEEFLDYDEEQIEGTEMYLLNCLMHNMKKRKVA
tara:strand:+ start:524 stop:2182 length:1659 start_codon:yes stop_codon:yes gene_type:complete